MFQRSAAAASRRHAAFAWARWLLALVLTLSATGCASLPSNTGRRPSQAFATPEQTALGQLVVQRRMQDRARQDSGFALLDSVDAALAARLALIGAAQRTLDLQYYAIHADASTELLLEGLRQAARRGVRVRILLDDFNAVGEDAQVLRLALEPNIELRLFNPLPGSRLSMVGRIMASLGDMPRIQKRMHNKVFIADNAVGITGGRNLGDAYFGSGGDSNFVDLDVLAVGGVVRHMSASFDRYWNDELAYPVQSLVSPEELERLRQTTDTLQEAGTRAGAVMPTADQPPRESPPSTAVSRKAARPPPPALDLRRLPLAWAPAVFLHDRPGKIASDEDDAGAGETVIDGLLAVMEQARQEVLIVSPYFVPGPAMTELFARLRQRGVRLRVLTNSLASNDAPATHAGYARYRERLLALGVELHEMRADPEGIGGLGSGAGLGSGPAAAGSKTGSTRASLHSKAVLIDQRLSVIGSMNLDLRSQHKNSEVALLIRSRAVALQAQQQVEAMIAHGAYRPVAAGDGLTWQAPPGARFRDETTEPGASVRLRLLVRLLAPFAPDEML